MHNAIVILGGGLIKDKNGTWKTTNFEEGDNFGALGDRLRIVAGSYLYKKNSNQLIIASGGKGQFKNIADAPNISDVIKKELIELNIPPQKIITETESGNTYQQLKALKKLIKKFNLKEIIIISNEYQLLRVNAMLKFTPDIKDIFATTKITLESAEKILINYGPKKYENIIKKAYQSKQIKDRINLEKKGVKQIIEGTYKFI